MRFFVNLSNNQVGQDLGDRNHIAAGWITKRGADEPVEIQFHRDGVPELLAAGVQVLFGCKTLNQFDGSYLTSVTAFTAPADASGFYRADLPTSTAPINTALGSPDGVVSNDVTAIQQTTTEIQWWPNGPTRAPRKSLTFSVRIENTPNNGDELAVASGTPIPSPVSLQGAVVQADRLFACALRDYAADGADWIDRHLAGKTPSAGATDGSGNLVGAGTVNLFSAGNYTTGTGYVWNSALWCGELDFSCFSPWNSTENQYQGGTLITPKHVWLANHFSGPAVPLASFTTTSNGSGYTSAPTVTISGGGGSGATATATISAGAVTSVTVTAPGSGYATPPTVTITGGGGSGAAATAVLAGNPGSYPMAIGTQIKFVGTDGALYSRTFTAFNQLGSSDVLIGTLDADLPASVRPARFLPPGTSPNFLPAGTPVIFCNKNKEARVAEVGNFAGNNIVAATAANRVAWTLGGPGYGGDSGSPDYLVLDGQAVVWWEFLNPNHGETPLDNLSALNAVLGSYQLSFAALRAVGTAAKADLGTAPGNVAVVQAGGLLDPGIVPGNGSVAAGAGAPGSATSTGLGGAPGAYTGPSITMKSGDGGVSASVYNGGAGGVFIFGFTMRGGTGGASLAGSTGGTGGVGGNAGNGIVVLGGDGGASNGATGGNGGIGGSITLKGGKGGQGTVTYGAGANGGPAGGIDLSGGNAGFGANAIYAGGAGGAVISTGSAAAGGHVGYTGGTLNMSATSDGPGGSIYTGGGGGAISTKPVAFASAPSPVVEGTIQPFTDSTTNTWGATITGSGSYHVLGYFNGTNWTVLAK